jgi:hypothetical protein
MSRRAYKLDSIAIDFINFEYFCEMVDEINFANCSLALNSVKLDDQQIEALSALNLIECNPHVQELVIDEDHIFTVGGRMIPYLAKRCREVKKVRITSASAESVRLVMASFPNLSRINVYWCSSIEYDSLPDLGEKTSYPSIESFHCIDDSGLHDDMSRTLIKACPNLTSFDCSGPSICYLVADVLASCRKVTDLALKIDNEDESDERELAPMLSAIAEHGLQLKELSINLSDVNINIDDAMIRNAMVRIIQRLRKLRFTVQGYMLYESDSDDALDASLCSLFDSTGVDLQSLEIDTSNDNSDQIAMLLQGCRNADRLILDGTAKISEVLMKISHNCNQLVELELHFAGSINDAAMRALLQSCRQLRSLKLRNALEIEAYEALALHGGSLTQLILCPQQLASNVGRFATGSSLYNPSFKQQRKQVMAKLICEGSVLNVNSLAKFLSSFGVIEQLYIELRAALLPANIQVDMYDEIPHYHARYVSVRTSHIFKRMDGLDAVFLAMMGACRSIRNLRLEPIFPNRCFVDSSTLIKYGMMCKVNKIPLGSLTCPNHQDLSQIQELLPELRLSA